MHSGGGGGIFGGLMQRATRGSWENEASHDGSSDRVDADVASVISFNMNEFDAETQKRVFKRTSSFVMEETPEEKQHTNCCIRCLVSVWSFLEAHWSALLTSSFIFLVLSIGSVALCILYFQGLEEQMEEEGLELALETGRYFSTELAKTTLPLLSMSQLVHELDIFTNLTNQIGAGNEEGGLPFSTSRPNYRNLTGSPCLDLNLRVKFNQVAFQIRKSFSSLERGNMGGEPVLLTNSLLSLSLAPAGVLCLTTPEIDSENFETNHPLNTTHRLGFDYTATYTASQLFGNATAPAVHLDGPTLMTIPCRKGDSGGAGGGCRGDGVSAWVFEVRLPVEIPGLQLQLLQEDGTRTAYPFWGMVVSHVRWDAIIESSTVFQDFEDMGFHFQMVRSGLEAHHGDIQVHGDNEGHIMNDGDAPILLESLRFQEVLTLKNYHVDTIALDPTFTGDEWSMTVVHRAPAQERIWMIPLLVFVSLCVSFLIFKILLQKQEHSSMKGRAMAQESQFETERNMTAYFAHELRNRKLTSFSKHHGFFLSSARP